MTSVDHAVTNSMSRFIDPLQSVPFLSFLHRVSSFNIFLNSTHLMFQTWRILQKNSSYSKYRLVAFQLNISQFPMLNMLNQLYFSTKTSRNKTKRKKKLTQTKDLTYYESIYQSLVSSRLKNHNERSAGQSAQGFARCWGERTRLWVEWIW